MSKRFTKLDDGMIERIRSMHGDGRSYRQIGKELGISARSVSKYANAVDDRAGVSADVDALLKEIELLKHGMRVMQDNMARMQSIQKRMEVEQLEMKGMLSQIQSMIQAQASTQQSPSPQAPQAPLPQVNGYANGYHHKSPIGYTEGEMQS